MTDEQYNEIVNRLKTTEVLMRVNNLLLSRFLLELHNFKKKYKVRDTVTYFRFELERSQYDELVSEYGGDVVDRALRRLDRMLIENKQQCPNNIYKYIRRNCGRGNKHSQHTDDTSDVRDTNSDNNS